MPTATAIAAIGDTIASAFAPAAASASAVTAAGAGLATAGTAAAVGTGIETVVVPGTIAASGIGAGSAALLTGAAATGSILAATEGGAAAATPAAGAPAVAGGSKLGTIASGIEGAGALVSGYSAIQQSNIAKSIAKMDTATAAPGTVNSPLGTLAMPNPNDPAILNEQRTALALVQARSGRQSTNLSSGNMGNYSSNTLGGG